MCNALDSRKSGAICNLLQQMNMAELREQATRDPDERAAIKSERARITMELLQIQRAIEDRL